MDDETAHRERIRAAKSKAGKASAAKLTPEERTERARKAGRASRKAMSSSEWAALCRRGARARWNGHRAR
jgi:hypothetical protein